MFIEPTENNNASSGSPSSTTGFDPGIPCGEDNQSVELPPFPKFFNLTFMDSEFFKISFVDEFSVRFSLTVGQPQSHDLALLIRAYLALDPRARKVAILFRRFCRVSFF
ncbi:unnamed protein product [Protopolystoma xenopodis]|uniref:Uncharacterized protein n=1 Tax=Protopolystoma xenopodis TaxID=117903 RepID=A0A448WTG8_9PLAT|nr:unnamed protein product [Protopolystoma xenopodis]